LRWRVRDLHPGLPLSTLVLLFCGSKKSLASGLPMALVFLPATLGVIMLPLMISHQIQLVVCSVIASRLSRERAPA
jgi:solute carrier family 10 (sodium/bile acid cotransporter), member 7